MAFFFLMSTLVAALVLGIERIVLAGAVVAISAALSITVVLMFPPHAGDQPGWATDLGIAISTICSCVMIMATVWYALGEIERARKAIEQEYERSESLLTNILPTSVAARLKNPATTTIADKYDDASVLLADIAGYTKRASGPTTGVRSSGRCRPRVCPGGMVRTLVVTNDFPPRAGGIQGYLAELAGRLPAGELVVYAPDWPGAAEFDLLPRSPSLPRKSSNS